MTSIPSKSRFQIGDYVTLYGTDRWLVVGRFWRKSTQQIVYELEWPGNGGRVKEVEEKLRLRE